MEQAIGVKGSAPVIVASSEGWRGGGLKRVKADRLAEKPGSFTSGGAGLSVEGGAQAGYGVNTVQSGGTIYILCILYGVRRRSTDTLSSNCMYICLRTPASVMLGNERASTCAAPTSAILGGRGR